MNYLSTYLIIGFQLGFFLSFMTSVALQYIRTLDRNPEEGDELGLAESLVKDFRETRKTSGISSAAWAMAKYPFLMSLISGLDKSLAWGFDFIAIGISLVIPSVYLVYPSYPERMESYGYFIRRVTVAVRRTSKHRKNPFL